MNKTIFGTGIFFGLLGIALGAFGAHGLEKVLEADALKSFETGVRYQMYHALFLLVLGMENQLGQTAKKQVFFFIISGVLLFSFSIYFLSTEAITGIDFGIIALLTPLGGLFLILGWLLLGYRVFKHFS
ncbi:DUF423 domain-containing protein [Poritiphilus flavus]|uniref:DUF423 domain-containing protein n=1 Tax=Poritiphilus flavus TaxID=2697053 RepID=A0A6L9EDH1_9FLAO|nr:DUF423 domain-containing protein [Poritiphilus flavus]NAS12703.1 DUF423 domain-containing protein [Poritiphilus flavus]